jgi:hypothetical protein
VLQAHSRLDHGCLLGDEAPGGSARRLSKHFLVIVPNKTVTRRLQQQKVFHAVTDGLFVTRLLDTHSLAIDSGHPREEVRRVSNGGRGTYDYCFGA